MSEQLRAAAGRRLTAAQRRRIVEMYEEGATWPQIQQDEAAGKPSSNTIGSVLRRAGVMGRRPRPGRPNPATAEPADSTDTSAGTDSAAPADEAGSSEPEPPQEPTMTTSSSGTPSSSDSMPEYPGDPMTELVPVPDDKNAKKRADDQDEDDRDQQCKNCLSTWRLDPGEATPRNCPVCEVSFRA